jgi:hypothetical protein
MNKNKIIFLTSFFLLFFICLFPSQTNAENVNCSVSGTITNINQGQCQGLGCNWQESICNCNIDEVPVDENNCKYPDFFEELGAEIPEDAQSNLTFIPSPLEEDDDDETETGTGKEPIDGPGTGKEPIDGPGTGKEPIDGPGTGKEEVDYGTPASEVAKEAVEAQIQELPNFLGTTDVNEVIGRIVRAIIGISGSFALAVFIYGGALWMFSGGNPERVKKGRSAMIYAAIGLVVIFLSYTLVSFILRALG